MDGSSSTAPTREQLIFSLNEAAELEHNLMCTYLYAAFSLKDGEAEGLTAKEAEAVARWRRAIIDVAIDEMGHLSAVWNITSALGGAPHFWRDNFPLSPGRLPASVVVKLAPFNEDVLQHFIFLERPHRSEEPDGAGFKPEMTFKRGVEGDRLTPMPLDYDTVGDFYAKLSADLSAFVASAGENAAFCGDPGLQLSAAEVDLTGCKPVICLKTAVAAFDAIVTQGEGAPADTTGSHFQRFIAVREEMKALKAANANFEPAFPAAHNPVLRIPPNPQGRVWLEDARAVATVDLANACYGLMLRLLGYSYALSGPSAEKSLAVDLSIEMMRAVSALGEHAARFPAGPSNPNCNAGMSFSTLRNSAPLPRGPSTRRFLTERMQQLARAADVLAASGGARALKAAQLLDVLAQRAVREFANVAAEAPAPQAAVAAKAATPAPPSRKEGDLEIVEGEKLTILYQGKKCIHTRWCVTGAPKVFLANVEGPWIHPDDMDVEELAGIARECPSGAIAYRRNDGQPDEAPPEVNLARIMEGGPYAVRADIRLNGEAIGYRATLCRCGKSKNKPFCDGSHHDEPHFDATGEPATTEKTAMLAVRDGPLEINPSLNGPLMLRGNFEIMAGTGRMVARVTKCALCRCGHSNTKPFCDGTHAKIGFNSDGH